MEYLHKVTTVSHRAGNPQDVKGKPFVLCRRARLRQSSWKRGLTNVPPQRTPEAEDSFSIIGQRCREAAQASFLRTLLTTE